jgi:hypothetical protein
MVGVNKQQSAKYLYLEVLKRPLIILAEFWKRENPVAQGEAWTGYRNKS